jgi:predicted transcriptional regulator
MSYDIAAMKNDLMATVEIHIDPRQKRRLARLAKLRGKSFSHEIHDAVDLYLALPIENEEQLSSLAHAANRSADRMIKKLDEAIAYVDRTVKHTKKAAARGVFLERPES